MRRILKRKIITKLRRPTAQLFSGALIKSCSAFGTPFAIFIKAADFISIENKSRSRRLLRLISRADSLCTPVNV